LSQRKHHARIAGFTLIEVMVALLVISIGLLGIAKMQALALSSTGNARTRDLPYWSSFASGTTFTITVTASSSTVSATGVTLAAAPSAGCTYSATCAPDVLAAQDLANWATHLHTALPTSTGTIACTGSSLTPAPGTPVTCQVRIDWTENLVELNTGMNAALTSSQNTSALQGGSGSGVNSTNGAATHFILFVDL
jgi:type IV pilus assembly protein PilV